MASFAGTSASSFFHPITKHRLPSAFPRPFSSSSSSSSSSSRLAALKAVAYMERKPNSAVSIASKVIGSLPIVGLLARIFNDEGGTGDDLVDFAEFRRRVGKKCGVTDSRAFYEFQDRRGRAGDPLYVLLCCWLAAIGAGLLKSEEILEGVARLRISNDIELEEQNFFAMMNAAKEKRAKSRSSIPEVPMEIRVEKALDAIYVCCFGNDPIEEEDVRLLCIMLNAVFPSVGKSNIDKLVKTMAKEVTEGEKIIYPQQKPTTQEVRERQLKELQQLKDLKFLKKRTENSS